MSINDNTNQNDDILERFKEEERQFIRELEYEELERIKQESGAYDQINDLNQKLEEEIKHNLGID